MNEARKNEKPNFIQTVNALLANKIYFQEIY